MNTDYRTQCGDKILITMHYANPPNRKIKTIFDLVCLEPCLEGEVGNLEYAYDGLTPKMILRDWLSAYIGEKGLATAYSINLEQNPEAKITIVKNDGARIYEVMTLDDVIEEYLQKNLDAIYMI